MHIAIDIREAVKPKKTGKGWYAFEMTKNLLTQHPEDTFTLYTDQPYPEWEHFSNATQQFFPPSALRWHFKVTRDLKKLKPDIFFAPTSFIIAALAPKSQNVIVTVHDLVAWLYATHHNLKATIIERLTLPLAIKNIKKFVTVSQNTKRDLQHFFKIPSEKIEIVPCAASENFKPATENAKKQENTSYFLAVGTLEPRKNFITLIKAFAEIAKKHPEYSLNIIGGKGWYFEKIFATVRDLKLENSVHFLGYIDDKDLPSHYQHATALVFPSLYEGFGIPPLEAMKSGCPVIASNTSSIPEVVGDAALLVDPSSAPELTQAMLRVIKEPELRDKLRKKGLIQAEKFSWSASAKKLYQMMKSTV